MKHSVIIVGAGPVGLTLAWQLSGKGISVKVFEAEDKIPDELRASTFHPPTLDMFDASGITSELIASGRITPEWQIRQHETGERAEFDLSVISDHTAHPFRLQCRQARLCDALMRRLPDGTVAFGVEVQSAGQDQDGAWVDIDGERMAADYVVGCDGAHSAVREALDTNLEGKTYPDSTVLATTTFPFEDYLEGLSGVNYIWFGGGTYSLLRLPELWRLSLHPDGKESPEQALSDDSIRAKSLEIVPEADSLGIVEKRIYRVHQRIVSHYFKGRLILAGDAAHLNSPKGGMGMNGGVHDAFNLSEKLEKVLQGTPSQEAFDLYQRQRRPIAADEILAQADANHQRMNTKDPARRKEYLSELQKIAADKDAACNFLLKSSMIAGLNKSMAIA